MMNIRDFVEGLRVELEIETNIDVNTNLKNLEEWDSLNGMILISYVSENFNISLTGDDVSQLTSIQSLIDKIGVEKFDNT